MAKPRKSLMTCAILLCASCFSGNAATKTESLSLCGQCLNPSVSSKSGIGTASAAVEARITKSGAEAWCANWHPDDANCASGQMSSDEAKKTYRASANCIAGQITAIDGRKYTRDGLWTTGIGKGRARFRNARGGIVAQDDNSGGLAIAQQWELLCPALKKPSPGH